MRVVKAGLRGTTDHSTRRRLWNRVIDAPVLSRLYYLLDPDVRHLRLRRGTDLLIDGFPRSANTYVTEAIRLANPELVLTHHLHQPRVIEWAVAREVPTLLLVREPDAVVASFATFAPETPAAEIYASYAIFYERLLPLVPEVVLADFDEAVSKLDEVLAAIRTQFGLDLQAPEEGRSAEIFDRVDAFSARYFGSDDFESKVSRPSEHRPRTNANVIGPSSAVRERAKAAYAAVLEARRPLPTR